MKFNQLFVFLVLLVFTACKTEQAPEESNPLAHSTPTMVDVVGEFKGDLPCDNCDKEIVTLKFLMDKTAFKSVARVNGNGSTAGIGKWELNGDEVKVEVNGSESYTLKGNQLQKTIDGKVYVLQKLDE